jgi:hypothetical protein
MQLAALSGVVQSTAGSPLAGAQVCVWRPAEACCAASSCARSDGAGRFSLQVLQTGAPVLIASADGHLSLRRSLSEVARQSPLVVSLEPGGVRVRGSVLDASGGPISDALRVGAVCRMSGCALAARRVMACCIQHRL